MKIHINQSSNAIQAYIFAGEKNSTFEVSRLKLFQRFLQNGKQSIRFMKNLKLKLNYHFYNCIECTLHMFRNSSLHYITDRKLSRPIGNTWHALSTTGLFKCSMKIIISRLCSMLARLQFELYSASLRFRKFKLISLPK